MTYHGPSHSTKMAFAENVEDNLSLQVCRCVGYLRIRGNLCFFQKTKSNQKQVLLGLQTQKNTEHHRTFEIATNQDKSFIMLYIIYCTTLIVG